MENKLVKIIFPVLLVLAIGLSPGIPFGNFSNGKTVELRVEDFLMAGLILLWIADYVTFRQEKFRNLPLFLLIAVSIGISFLSLVLNSIFGDFSFVRGIFYVLKEIQCFFLFFYFFCYIKNAKAVKAFVGAWFFIVLVNVAYVLYQVFIGKVLGNAYQFFSNTIANRDYGAVAFAEEGALPRGMFFLLLFIFLINIFLYHFLNLNISKIKKFFLGLVSFSPAIGLFYSGSRTALLGFILSLILMTALLLFKKRNFKIILVLIAGLVLLVVMVSLLPRNFEAGNRIVGTVSSIDILVLDTFKSRMDLAVMPLLREAVSKNNFLLFTIGLGRGYFGEAHSQYALNFMSVGIVGSVIFFILVFSLIRKSWKGFFKSKNALAGGFSAGLFIATVVMLFCSLASDPFLVVKSAEVYWSFAGVAMAMIKPKFL